MAANKSNRVCEITTPYLNCLPWFHFGLVFYFRAAIVSCDVPFAGIPTQLSYWAGMLSDPKAAHD